MTEKGSRVNYALGMNREELYITARMARLELCESAGEVDRLEAAVIQLLDYFSKMREIDVEDLPPTSQLSLQNRLREDVVAPSDLTDRLLENAPEREDRFLSIPNVL